MSRLLITVLFAVVFVAVLRIQAKDANLISKKFLRKREVQEGTGLSESEIKAFLDKHNFFRHDTSPTAKGMKDMVWNIKLAEMAQKWSDNCVFAHGQPKGIEKPFEHVGQNLFVTSQTGRPNGDAVSTYWHNEVKNYNFETNTCSGTCGHYTQEVWSDSTDLGCGMAFCPKLTDAFDNAWLVTCNYGPAGNYVGEKPYIKGV